MRSPSTSQEAVEKHHTPTPNPGTRMAAGVGLCWHSSHLAWIPFSLYLDEDEFAPQGRCIWELLPEAQHDSAVWETALVVVVLLQLCKDTAKIAIGPPEAARLCCTPLGSNTQAKLQPWGLPHDPKHLVIPSLGLVVSPAHPGHLGTPAVMASKWSKGKGLHPFNPQGPRGSHTGCKLQKLLVHYPKALGPQNCLSFSREVLVRAMGTIPVIPSPPPAFPTPKRCQPGLFTTSLTDHLKSTNPGIYFPQERTEALAPKKQQSPTNLGRTSWCQRSSPPHPGPVCWACPCRPWCCHSRKPCPGTAS